MTDAQEWFDNHAGEYEGRFTDPVALEENRWTFNRIAQLVDVPDSKILDVGCGTGLLLDYLKPRVYTGIDVSAAMLAIARAKHPTAFFHREDIRDSWFHSDNFDAIISTFASLSYVDDADGRLADKFCHWLKPRGRIFLQYFGPDYARREDRFSYEGVKTYPVTAEILRDRFEPYFTNIQIFGLNFNADANPRIVAGEARALGMRSDPNRALFLGITATKRV